MDTSALICPVTRLPLSLTREGAMSTSDGKITYRFESGFPILLGPEAVTDITPWPRDIKAPQYAEAYAEMPFYNSVATEEARQIRTTGSLETNTSAGLRLLSAVGKLSLPEREAFPLPIDRWLSSTVDAAAEADCILHIGSVKGKRVIQIGGKGTTAILLLLAGASEAILLTPMLGEARLAWEAATLFNVQDRLRPIIGIAEEIPVASTFVDVCFVGGCVHHMRTEVAFAEMSRVLVDGGKFAAIEPWRAPGYTWGTKIFGKREANAHCSPLNRERLLPFYSAFAETQFVQHGSFTRYPAIVAEKFGLVLTSSACRRMMVFDDKIANIVPFARKLGSGVALLGTK
jgi:SAM-dependent methyltransferase